MENPADSLIHSEVAPSQQAPTPTSPSTMAVTRVPESLRCPDIAGTLTVSCHAQIHLTSSSLRPLAVPRRKVTLVVSHLILLWFSKSMPGSEGNEPSQPLA